MDVNQLIIEQHKNSNPAQIAHKNVGVGEDKK